MYRVHTARRRRKKSTRFCNGRLGIGYAWVRLARSRRIRRARIHRRCSSTNNGLVGTNTPQPRLGTLLKPHMPFFVTSAPVAAGTRLPRTAHLANLCLSVVHIERRDGNDLLAKEEHSVLRRLRLPRLGCLFLFLGLGLGFTRSPAAGGATCPVHVLSVSSSPPPLASGALLSPSPLNCHASDSPTHEKGDKRTNSDEREHCDEDPEPWACDVVPVRESCSV